MRIVKILIAIISLSFMMFSCSKDEAAHPLEGSWLFTQDMDFGETDDNGELIVITTSITVTFTAATVTWETVVEGSANGEDMSESCSVTGSWTEVVDENTGVNTITVVLPDEPEDAEETPCPDGEAEGTYVINGDQLVFTISDEDGSMVWIFDKQ